MVTGEIATAPFGRASRTPDFRPGLSWIAPPELAES